MKFRLDINGLRAIAVLMVAVYHFKYQFGYGGYAGVDVFFVISGFLMAEIWKKNASGVQAAVDFYSRRLRRIYPALLVFSFLTFCYLSLHLGPNSLWRAAIEHASALLFVSNIYYWSQTGGYFGASADSFPLLHTWSLSLEWQFYLLFPLVTYLVHIVNKRLPAWAVYSVLGLVSLALCLISYERFPDAAFFLLPTRAWELLLGAAAATFPYRNPKPRTTEAISLLTIFAFFLGAKNAAGWPGLWTLVPTLAAAALLQANVGNAKTLLRFRFFQILGSSSYSIYLAHWPIAYFFHQHQIAFSAFNAGIGLLISILVGYVSYQTVERHFRLGSRGLIGCGLITVGVVLAIGHAAPMRERLSPLIVSLDRYEDYPGSSRHSRQFGNLEKTCFLTSRHSGVDEYSPECVVGSDKPGLLLIGDSHAAQLAEAVQSEFSDYGFSQVTASGCAPTPLSAGYDQCVELMRGFYSRLENHDFDLVLVAADWQAVSSDPESLAVSLVDAVRRLSASGAEVYIIGQSRVFDTSVLRLISLDANLSSHEVDRAKVFDEYLKTYLRQRGINYISVYDFNCAPQCDFIDSELEPIMFDKSHLTPAWSRRQVSFIRRSIAN